MKKNITIAILALACILSLSFAYTQKLRADENLVMAERAEVAAREMTKRAYEQMAIAEAQAKRAELAIHEAMAQQSLAVEAAEKAKKSK